MYQPGMILDESLNRVVDGELLAEAEAAPRSAPSRPALPRLSVSPISALLTASVIVAVWLARAVVAV
jgi:hypothetical protein